MDKKTNGSSPSKTPNDIDVAPTSGGPVEIDENSSNSEEGLDDAMNQETE